MMWRNRLVKWFGVGTALAVSGAGAAGCLSRPVGTLPPTTKVNFTSTVSQQQVDKVDLLLMIDNSASMGDKQDILKDAVPELVKGLLSPKCVDPNGNAVGNSVADPNGDKANNYGCPQGSEPEFKPVTDMHIGIISSSLGAFGGDVCPDSGRLNDRAHLLNFAEGGGEVPEAAPSNFLAWFPTNTENGDTVRHPKPANPTTDIGKLNAAFGSLVVGVEQNGCGLEAQLESIYRFLIQPDPWVKVTRDNNDQATLGTDVDVTLLQQRADFLRPDSLVAVIALTDEDDSSVDPLTVSGNGWAFMANQFPGSTQLRADGQSTTAPRASSTCKTDPLSTDCTSCGFAGTCNPSDAACQKLKNDSECTTNGGYYGANDDSLNVRFHRMKQRFGIDPQYPIRRYVDGFTKYTVPDRKAEHEDKAGAGGGRRAIGPYSGAGTCTNPLFAQKLPRAGDDYCKLTRSTRSPDLIFFAVVGGVPNEILPPVGSEAAPDWVKILGRSPETYNYDGIDPHMIQSVTPRPGLPGPSATRGDNGNDPIHGREWETASDDLQYACTFALPTARTCTKDDPSCDCAGTTNPPLCGAAAGQQTRAKAYPTIREFMVAKAMGDNGIAASLCPISLTVAKTDPTYGYNPAVAAIITRLKNALTTQCLPQKLTRDEKEGNTVPCLVLAQLGDRADTCAKFGLAEPAAEIKNKFLEQQKELSGNVGDGGIDLASLPVCEVTQLSVAAGDTCKDDPKIGWCYVENSGDKQPAGRCPQALIFSGASGAMVGARFSLQCIQQFNPGEAAGDQK